MSTAGLPDDQHDFGMAKGHSPVADKVVCIDFDGTLVPWGPLMGEKDLLPGAADALMAFQEAGYRVVVWTSRVSKVWAHSVVGWNAIKVVAFTEKQRRYIVETLRRGAPDFQIGDIISEKIPAQLYIDDKAVGFRGDWEDTFAEAIRIMG